MNKLTYSHSLYYINKTKIKMLYKQATLASLVFYCSTTNAKQSNKWMISIIQKYIDIGTIIVILIITFECNSNAFLNNKDKRLEEKKNQN